MKKVFISRQPAPLRLARPGRRVSPWLIFLFLLLTGCGVKKDISQPKNYMPTASILMVVAPKDFATPNIMSREKFFPTPGRKLK